MQSHVCCKRSFPVAKSMNFSCSVQGMCFISPPSTSSTLRGHEGVAVGASAVVVFRVGSVVAKVYVASRNEKLPLDVIRRGEEYIHDFLLQRR